MGNIARLSAALAAVMMVPAFEGFAQAPSRNAAPAGKTAAQKYVELVAQNDVLKNSLFGVCARTEGGRTLVSWNSGKRMLPASNMKLISTGAGGFQVRDKNRL